MTPQSDYVDFCNWAEVAISAAEGKLDEMSDERLAQLQSLLREEADAAYGRVELVVVLIKALVDDELAARIKGH